MSIEVTKLEQRVTVALNHMPHLETVAFGTWVKAGARNELVNEHGIAHLLEHMAFKGTRKRSAREIVEEIENVGGDINAATSVETTAYHARMMSDDIELGMDVLHDILRNSTFEPERELQREKHVILQEIGAANDQPDDLVFDLFQNAAYGGQPIGRPILGTPETVTGFSARHLNSYLGEHYRGPNMVIAAAGKIDSPKVLTQIESFTATLWQRLQPAATGQYVGGEALIERETTETQIVLGFEGRAYQAKDFYASQLLSMILGGGMSSRLFQEIREKRGYCYSVYAFHWGFSDTGVFGINAATGDDDLAKADAGDSGRTETRRETITPRGS